MEGAAGEVAFMAASAGKAFIMLMDPVRLMYLGAGRIMGDWCSASFPESAA